MFCITWSTFKIMEASPLEKHSHLGTAGWVGFFALAGAFDVLSPETLSQASRRAFKAHPIATTALYGVTTAHLAGVIPDRLDPFKQGFKVIEALVKA